MAEATFARPEVETPPATFTLVLTEAEALYVYGALAHVEPTEAATAAGVVNDAPYEAIGVAMADAGIDASTGYEYARVF